MPCATLNGNGPHDTYVKAESEVHTSGSAGTVAVETATMKAYEGFAMVNKEFESVRLIESLI